MLGRAIQHLPDIHWHCQAVHCTEYIEQLSFPSVVQTIVSPNGRVGAAARLAIFGSLHPR